MLASFKQVNAFKSLNQRLMQQRPQTLHRSLHATEHKNLSQNIPWMPSPKNKTNGTIVSWHKHAGEYIKPDEKIVTVSFNDNLLQEVRTPVGGLLEKTFLAEREKIESGKDLFSVQIGSTEEKVNLPQDAEYSTNLGPHS
ncbi:hypothetical protein PROFUN_04574 [Planoprotostelium fungivorum]|uniref:Lipoyl-binding domain-containing protein n=1 Tax=Planoprotostelium fungivorum TaxID=1890364 RepID=A0A2P6NBK3_9EUKA|nr:hypothetical protein PROFUN_04574 [Planoprotostelium fungivorum]